jgi:hypothetical protein
MTIRSTVYLDPGVDDAIIAEMERMPFRRRAGRLVQLLRIGAETSLRQRDGTLRGGLIRCRSASISATTRVRVGIRLSGPADAAIMQLLAESPNRRTERLRQLAQCGLEREAYWAQEGAQGLPSGRRDQDRPPATRVRPSPFLTLGGAAEVEPPNPLNLRDAGRARTPQPVRVAEARWLPTGTLFKRTQAESED